jgi:Flp pilus assembly protein TadD
MTAMAQASGRAADLHLPDGEVFATNAKVTYSVTGQDGKPQLHFRKRMADGTTLEGSKVLTYYIGSGTHGRGFIFEEQGQAFQTPVAYYGVGHGWDVAPGYEDESVIFLGRKVETACLSCHTSGSKPGELFEEGAVSCERCHGPGEQHAKSVRSAIVNPRKLDPERRDSICAQCHLTGETRVVKPGRSETTFRPGDLLGDHVVPFVWSSPDKAEFKVVGHFEGLWQSKCKRMSGDKLSCLTCHDPHIKVADNEKSAYYRQKCLGCHEQASCKLPIEARNAKGDSCIACHMQQRASTDGQHTAFTDHSIRRNAHQQQTVGHSRELVAFWTERATARDYALAYADEAWQHGDAASFKEAHEKLQGAAIGASGDAALAAQLAYTDDLAGEPDKAEALYQQALKVDPENLLALTNLGTHLARKGQIDEAVDLWRRALAINPGLPAPGLNLARGQLRQGRDAEALETVRRVLSLNPDSEAGLVLQRELERRR